MTIRQLFFVLFVFFVMNLSAQVDLRWDAQIERPSAYEATVFRGETIRLMPRLVRGTLPADLSGAAATLYWQTNGMGSAWWNVPAAVSATETGRVEAVFAPTNDFGAARYTWFVRTASASGSAYRAFGTLAMRDSPGWSPTSSPPAAYAWVAPGELQAVSNALASAVQAEALLRIAGDAAATNYAASLAAALPGYAAITNIAAAVASPLVEAHANRLDNPHAVTAEQVGALPLAGGEMAFNALLKFPSADATQRSYMSAALIEVYDGDAYHGMTANGTQIGVWPGGGIDLWSYPSPNNSTYTYSSREWALEQIDAIPRVPTNAVQGWLMYDPGSNMWLRVSVSNWSFTVWEVTP